MKRLKEICMEIIHNNLQIIYWISRSNDWKIPFEICGSIYNFFSSNIYDFEEKDLEILYLPSFSISNLVISRKFYYFPEFFLKIRAEGIKKITLCINTEEGWFSCLENLIKRVKNVECLHLNFICIQEDVQTKIFNENLQKAFHLLSTFFGETLLELKIFFSEKFNLDMKNLVKFKKK